MAKNIVNTVIDNITDYVTEQTDAVKYEKSEYDRVEAETTGMAVDVANVYVLQIPSQINDGTLKSNQYSIYTSAQIERMREEIAYADADGNETEFIENLLAMNKDEPDISSGNFADKTGRIISTDDAVKWIDGSLSSTLDASAEDNPSPNAECIQHAKDGWIDTNFAYSEKSDSGDVAVCTNNWNIQPSTITSDSSIEDIMKEYASIDNARNGNEISDSILDQMRSFVAEADAVAGETSYEENLTALKNKTYSNETANDVLYADAESDEEYSKSVEHKNAASGETMNKAEKAEETLGEFVDNSIEIEETLELS